MNKNILFVSQKKARCGVYEFGKNITEVLQNSKRHRRPTWRMENLVSLKHVPFATSRRHFHF